MNFALEAVRSLGLTQKAKMKMEMTMMHFLLEAFE
jgi:hypothetical protein